MGLLSLFSPRKGNDPAPARRRRTEPGAGIASSRRLADDYADDTLDPDFPQKQRARRRLIGAVVMLAIAIIVLPRVFESKPRPVAEDVAVKVSSGPGATQKPKVEARKAQPLPPQPQATQARNDAQALDPDEELVSSASPARAAAARTADKGADKSTDKSADKGADKPADKPADKADTKVADARPQGSGKYMILIGAFSSEERAKNWLDKLKASKVPAYVEKKKLADGDRILLRAGPFSDRDAADAADKRVKATGLTSKIVEM